MPSFSAPFLRLAAIPWLLLCPLAACRAPRAVPLETADLTAAVATRDASPEELGAALELAGLQPLALARPEDATDPRQAEFWHACAWAWSPATREVRRRLQAASARADSAGRPGPIWGMLEIRELDQPEDQTRLMLAFDLIGVLGLGPAEAARVLADAQVRSALNALEEAMWTTRFEVDGARVRLAAARAASESLVALEYEARSALERIEILERNGRLSTGSLASARLALRKLTERRAQVEQQEAVALERLAVASGLVPNAAALNEPGAQTLASWPVESSDPGDPTPSELLDRLPGLRALLLDYAIAESRLREVASRRWPDLSLGPHLFWSDPDFLLGSVLRSGLPWPGSLDGEIEAARIERLAARERVEDGLLAALSALAAARDQERAARRALEQGARPALGESGRLWEAAKARFSVDPTGLELWAHALGEQARALQGVEVARAEHALALLEIERRTGPAREAPRLVASPLGGDRP